MSADHRSTGQGCVPDETGRRRLAALARRRAVALAARAAERCGTEVRVVGGAVRDALLGLPGGDLDVTVERTRAAAFAEALATASGSRVVPIGRPERRVLHVPLGRSSVDVWERDGSPEADLLRRDFTVNALALRLPDGRLEAAPGALGDLARRRLSPPRPGVYLEDPVRVLRAARFLATLPGFGIARTALPELTAAASRLGASAPERQLAELGRILCAPRASAVGALRWLEARGALGAVLGGTTPSERRAGLRAIARAAPAASPSVLLVLLVSGAPGRAEHLLACLRAPREERALAEWLASRSVPRRPGSSRRAAVVLLRSLPRPPSEALELLGVLAPRRERALVEAARALAPDDRALARLRSPARLLAAREVAALLGVGGAELGRALEELGVAVAAGEAESPSAARRHLLAWRREPTVR